MTKKFLGAFFFILTQLSVWANDSTNTEVQLNPKKSGAAILIDLGFNNFLNAGNPYKLKALGSRGANIYYLYKIRLGYFFSIVPGIGMGFDNYSFQSENLRLRPDNGKLLDILDTTNNVSYFKSRLSATYIDIPVEFRFKSSQNNKKAFQLAIGGKIGFLINSKIKYKFEQDNIMVKEKQISNLYLNPVRYGLSARIGYGMFHLFGYYSLNPLFQEGKATELTPVMFGITFTSL